MGRVQVRCPTARVRLPSLGRVGFVHASAHASIDAIGASADFCNRIREPSDPRSLTARLQISPGIAHPPSRLCASDLRRRVPYMHRASHLFACSPHCAASIRFLFVAPALCFRLPSDSRSPEKPLPSANTCPCRLCRGLSPPSECALPGAQKERRAEARRP